MVTFTKFGRDLTSAGELKLAEVLEFDIPFWIKNYDRDRVAFYHKPMPNDLNKVLNADMPKVSYKTLLNSGENWVKRWISFV